MEKTLKLDLEPKERDQCPHQVLVKQAFDVKYDVIYYECLYCGTTITVEPA